MDIKKKDIAEIVDGNTDIIGLSDIPQNGSNLETQANKTTDQNVKVGTQPFRYDMLGRFGFTLLPFLEEGDISEEQTNLLDELSEIMFDRYVELMKFYYKNPNKLKSDYRKIVDGKKDSSDEDNLKYAKKIVNTIQKHFENAFKEPKTIGEGMVIEDKMVDKTEIELASKSEDMGVREKKIESLAGLINKKLNKKDLDKLINLLEQM